MPVSRRLPPPKRPFPLTAPQAQACPTQPSKPSSNLIPSLETPAKQAPPEKREERTVPTSCSWNTSNTVLLWHLQSWLQGLSVCPPACGRGGQHVWGIHGPAELQCTRRSWALGAQAMRTHTGQRAWVLYTDNKWASSPVHAPAGFRPTASRRTDGQARLARGERRLPWTLTALPTLHSLVLQVQLLLQLLLLRLQAFHLHLLVHHAPLQVREPPL